MSSAKVNSYWYDLNKIIKCLINEMDKEEGPDWTQVFDRAQDLMALSYLALHQPKDQQQG